MAGNKILGAKKAELLSIWWIFVLVIIAAGIVLGTLMFESKDSDARRLEADILANRIVNCIVDNGYANSGFLGGEFDIFANCGLDKEFMQKAGLYFIKVAAYGENGEEIEEAAVVFGGNFEKDCAIQESVLKAEYFPRCVAKEIRVLDSKNEIVRIEIKTGSNYRGKEINLNA